MQQPYILLKPDNFQFGGHFHALQSLENVQAPTASESFDSKKRSKLDGKRQKPLAMSRRNARERRRVKLINLGYETLRHHVPAGIENKKLSKVETLRAAVNYIKYLQRLLDSDDSFMLDNSQQNVSVRSESSSVDLNTESEVLESNENADVDVSGVKQERLDNSENCLLQQRDGNTAEVQAPKEDHVFIDIAKWLCQNSDSIKHSNFKLRGKKSVSKGFFSYKGVV